MIYIVNFMIFLKLIFIQPFYLLYLKNWFFYFFCLFLFKLYFFCLFSFISNIILEFFKRIKTKKIFIKKQKKELLKKQLK